MVKYARLDAKGYFGSGTVKAWLGINLQTATPTIIGSYNVASVTDNGVGDFTMNFINSLSSSTYAVISGAEADTINPSHMRISSVYNGTRTTGSVRIRGGGVASSTDFTDSICFVAVVSNE